MAKQILKRLGIGVFILFVFSLILFALMRLQPDDFVQQRWGALAMQNGMGDEFLDEIRRMIGLYGPFFQGYFRWLGNMLRGDMGYSLLEMGRPVTQVITEHMWLSFIMSLIALIISVSIAIPMGIFAATKQYSKFDYTTTALVMMGISLPAFFFAGLLIYIFAVQLGWFNPALGFGDAHMAGVSNASRFFIRAWHLVLPITVMVVLSIGGLMRYTRTNTLEVLRSDFIRTARAKGLSEGAVIYKHAFKNTAVPLATMMAGILPGLFVGSMIIEQIFGLPGVGQLGFRALQSGDIPLVMGYNMFIATLAVLGILLSDIMYVIVDPRIRMN
ncbi:MAG: ABC transporter permease [Firmicutes bacterium]|nr:ABC transporter permease [Bacillota bacterium]